MASCDTSSVWEINAKDITEKNLLHVLYFNQVNIPTVKQ